MMLVADTLHALLHLYLQHHERIEGSTELSYYASLVPELSMQACRLLHQLHVWYVHGLSFTVIDVLLLANTKARATPLPPRRCLGPHSPPPRPTHPHARAHARSSLRAPA